MQQPGLIATVLIVAAGTAGQCWLARLRLALARCSQVEHHELPGGHPPPVIAGLQGIEVDLCPVCRGVWLDRGELDKLIDRAVGLEAAVRARGGRRNHDDDDDDRSYREGASPSKPTSSGPVVLADDGAVRNAVGTPWGRGRAHLGRAAQQARAK